MFGCRSQAAVRVRVKKNEKGFEEEWRKFSVDPNLTSLEILYTILAKAFEIKCDFGISYKTVNPNTKVEEQLIIFSDWDLDAAFLRAHNASIANNSEPTLNLQIDIKPFSKQPDWEANNSSSSTLTSMNSNIQQSLGAGHKYVQNKLPGLIMNQMEKTLSIVTRALNFVDDNSTLPNLRPPLSDNEFRYYCDSVGQIIHQMELRKVIFAGGIDPSLRRVVWKHILNVYPPSLTGKERMDYIKRKSAEYYSLREVWRTAFVEKGKGVIGELAYVTNMVRKDVLRTDRHHSFYAGNDDNQNIGALFNILTTYALNHPSVSYCQGMSDMASPILVVMCDEAQAYICFCGLMSRMKLNFHLDGIAMTKKFAHLSEALKLYDIEFYNYLKHQQADDLLFCYRWLLLEMKREFAFEDSLRMLEILWSSLPIDQPEKDLKLFEKEFQIIEEEKTPPESPSFIMAETPYTKICTLRRQNSAVTDNQLKLNQPKRLNKSLDETMIDDHRLNVAKTHQSFDESKLMTFHQDNCIDNEEDLAEVLADSKNDSSIEDLSEGKNPFLYSDSTDAELPTGSDNSTEMKTITRGNSLAETLKELKEKLSASKIGIVNAIEKLEGDYDPLDTVVSEVKLVKNFSEFFSLSKRSNSEEKGIEDVKCFSNQNNSIAEDIAGGSTTTQPIHKAELSDETTLKSIQNVNIEIDQQASSIDARANVQKDETNRLSVGSTINEVFIWQNPLHASSDFLNKKQNAATPAATPDEQEEIEFDSERNEKVNGKKTTTNARMLSENTATVDKSTLKDLDNDSKKTDKTWNASLNANNPFLDQILLLSATQPDKPDTPNLNEVMTHSCEEASEIATPIAECSTYNESPSKDNAAPNSNVDLPPPSELGSGNPFLMFLCLTLLLQHRDFIIHNRLDANETAMHFDKMVRRHNVLKVIGQARRLYQDYLRRHNTRSKHSDNGKS